jgi:RimJ/RimL family protein N-acetyltransferase
MNSSWKQKSLSFALDSDQKISLIPYGPEHVSFYPQWFSTDPQLYQLTDTDPSVADFTATQQSIAEDPYSAVWIIYDNEIAVGDVGIFLHPWLEDYECEIEVMIAVQEFRRRGIAVAVIEFLIQFIKVERKERKKMIAKIKQGNIKSIRMFEKLGFKQEQFDEKFNTHILSLEF